MTKRETTDNWPEGGELHECSTCQHYKAKSDALGRCIARPPTLRGFPAVFPGDVCGEHKLSAEAIE